MQSHVSKPSNQPLANCNMNPLTILPLYIGFWEILLIVLVILLLVGGKKIPELMKGLGKGTKSFKEGLNEPEDQENQAEKK